MQQSSLELELVVIAALLASIVSAARGAGPVDNKPDENAKQAKTLVSVSGMAASDYAACVSELTSQKVVFEQLATAKEEGCELSGAVKLLSISTPFGEVSLASKPTMLCSFGRQFSGWVRDVAAPLTLGYTGQKLGQIETGSAFSCRPRYDKAGLVPSEHAKGDAIDISSFVLADGRRISAKPQNSYISLSRDLILALRTTACDYFTTVLGPGRISLTRSTCISIPASTGPRPTTGSANRHIGRALRREEVPCEKTVAAYGNCVRSPLATPSIALDENPRETRARSWTSSSEHKPEKRPPLHLRLSRRAPPRFVPSRSLQDSTSAVGFTLTL